MVTLQLTSGMISYPSQSKGIKKINISEPTRLEEILKKADIDLREVGIVLKDKQKVELSDMVEDGEYLLVLPHICGG